MGVLQHEGREWGNTSPTRSLISYEMEVKVIGMQVGYNLYIFYIFF